MVFSSISFLYFFLPAVLLIHTVLPKRFKNIALLIASLAFYFAAEQFYIVLLLFSSVVDYVCSMLISKGKFKKASVITSLVINLSLLGVFKYFDFFVGSINAAFGISIPLLRVALPVGISFYTFQTMSYTLDVYMGRVKASRNFLNFLTYVTLFPQLVAGPIVRYEDVEKELCDRKLTLAAFADGVSVFAIGLAKKVILSNQLAELVEKFSSSGEQTVLFHWMYVIAYCLQVYFDFSGYSDMAVGMGKMLGFNFPQNFNYPFISSTVAEYWRRWHITLGTWFRDYLYIPLGGSRCGKLKTIRNILIVWIATGLWHGAAWNFVLWGAFYGVVLCAERFVYPKLLKKTPKAARHIYVSLITVIGFTIFNGNGMSSTIKQIAALFGIGASGLLGNEALYYLKSYAIVIAVSAFAATPVFKNAREKLLARSTLYARVDNTVASVIPAVLIIVSTAYLVDGSFNPFLYFRF